MSKSESKPERPVIVPEYFSGEEPYEDWADQFEAIAEINGWDDDQKLKWLKVRLKGRALMAYKKFPVTVRALYKNGDDLRILVDKAYPSLDNEAWQQLALQRYLSQLDNEQVAFGVKQKIIEAAVSITLKCESFYLGRVQQI